MANSRWHRISTAQVAAPPEVLFTVLSDMPNYGEWLPSTKDVHHTITVRQLTFLRRRLADGLEACDFPV